MDSIWIDGILKVSCNTDTGKCFTGSFSHLETFKISSLFIPKAEFILVMRLICLHK